MSTEKPNRREFFKTSTAGIAALTMMKTIDASEVITAPGAELIEVTIRQLQAKMKSGELTARRIAEMYLERIREIDPKLRSVIETNPEALTIAEESDKERRRGKVRGMMHGIPILIKDNIDTRDQID